VQQHYDKLKGGRKVLSMLVLPGETEMYGVTYQYQILCCSQLVVFILINWVFFLISNSKAHVVNSCWLAVHERRMLLFDFLLSYCWPQMGHRGV
jgi:hypothetical protein